MLEKELVIILHMLEESLWNIYADKKKTNTFHDPVSSQNFLCFFFFF